MSPLQFGREAQREVSRRFAEAQFQRFEPVADEYGVDLVVRRDALTPFHTIQVKGVRWLHDDTSGKHRSLPYVFIEKSKMTGVDWVAIVLVPQSGVLTEDLAKDPSEGPLEIFLIPTTAWEPWGNTPKAPLTQRAYANGQKSRPEYGVYIARKHLKTLREEFDWEIGIKSI